MKDNLKNDNPRSNTFWLLLCVLMIAFGCKGKVDQQTHDEYTCPMHPNVVADKPGQCPVCHMDLVKKKPSASKVKNTAGLDYLLLPTNEVVISSVGIVQLSHRKPQVSYETKGIITYDTRRISDVAARTGGRVEKLFVKSGFQSVTAGQKILELYSPELAAAARELHYLVKSDKDNVALVDAARKRLTLFGISDAQIEQAELTGVSTGIITVYCQTPGYVLESKGQDSAFPAIREGSYVAAGQTMLRIANADALWAEFDFRQAEAEHVKTNDKIKISPRNGDEPIEASVILVEPFFKQGNNFVRVRTELKNTAQKIKIGQWVTGFIPAGVNNGDWLPRTAVINLGSRSVVFKKSGHVFVPTEIITGELSVDQIEVKKGIIKTDSIARNGQFLVDSDSFIKTARL